MQLISTLRAFVAAFGVAGVLAFAAPAHAGSTLSFVSEQGDWVGAGQTLSFSSGVTATGSSDNRILGVSVNTADHWYYLDLAAPLGQQLVPGVYENATRYPFNDQSIPGLSFFGDGRGCNTLTGSFQVLEAVYGPFGYVQKFHATFEQHCEGGTPALFGELSIDNPPPPPALTITVALDPKATVRRANGVATVGGTVTCSATASVSLSGSVTQRANRFVLAQGGFSTQSACSTTPTRWTATVSPGTATPFNQGTAQLDVHASGFDPNYGSYVEYDASGVVHFTTVKK
jgi:hypothetical protein